MTKAKVFLITAGTYSDYRILGACSTRYAATEWASLYPDYEIEEFELDQVPAHPSGHQLRSVRMDSDGNVVPIFGKVTMVCEPDSNANEWKQDAAYKTPPIATMWIRVWARDARHAIKIANEKRIQAIASGQWIENLRQYDTK